MALERLQKVLARAGVASRRGAEELMRAGRVTVNGRVADRPGIKVDPERDHIKVDGKLLRRPTARPVYLAVHKPRAMITSLADPEGRPTVADLLRAARIRRRVFPVGRLDWDAEGLLLVTDDGAWADRIQHPRHHLVKTYSVKVHGRPTAAALDRLRRGVSIGPGERTAPCRIRVERTLEASTWLTVELHEGRQNQLKRMFARIGCPVRRIRRTAVGPVRLGRMRIGEVRPLTPRELAALERALDAGTPVRQKGRAPRRRAPKSRAKTT
ncbi:MAG: pseudouridine synthase [Acidobacteriota bacterium]|nr:MAG: rRNA pseudouridine synthase [Acidobacteriota bacterium]